MNYESRNRRYNPEATKGDLDYSDEEADRADLLTLMDADCPTKNCEFCGGLTAQINEMCWKCWKSKKPR